MALLTGKEYITFAKPYLNQVADVITAKDPLEFARRVKEVVIQDADVKRFLTSVRQNDENNVRTVLQGGPNNSFRPIFNGKKWTEIDKSQFTGKSGRPDAVTTAKQEKAGMFAIQKSIENNGYSDQKAFMKLYRKDLLHIYSDMNEEWEDTFFQWQLTVQKKVGGTKYNHYSRDDGFMNYITKLVKTRYGISKKDTWNPADIWLVSNDQDNRKKLADHVEDDVTTIEQFNAILRGMFHDRKIVGISLKKMSGKVAEWELVNLENLDIYDDDEYTFKLDSIDISFKMKSPTDFKNSDTKIWMSSKKQRIKIQLRQNDSNISNLKFEANDLDATSAKLGKAPLDMVAAAFKSYGLKWDNDNKNYPRNVDDFNDNKSVWVKKFKAARVHTGLVNVKSFTDNVIAVFGSRRPDFVHSKLMQLHVVNEIISLNQKNRNELLTDLCYIAQKKGKVFGPFAKLY